MHFIYLTMEEPFDFTADDMPAIRKWWRLVVLENSSYGCQDQEDHGSSELVEEYTDTATPSVGEQAGCVAPVRRLTEEQVAQVFAAAEISRAYRRTQHEKLLEFIIKDHGADDHLLAVVSRKVSSKWLKNYENPKGHRVMAYIEDEELIDCLYNFLDEVLSRAVGPFERIDRVHIILEVLMPELYRQLRGFLCLRLKICSWMDQQTVSGTSCGK
ncbi:PWWP domain-containing DNA repair factor 3B-like [Polypterus senegalus]|uniref:PWWP domain-containing DNA repair factor 3B-like n=1 Tax=Polypterus senegalus TaxID=55291 RepID=UPI001962F6F5|nr:PWWP domain-containing DNA repair factor 3B-like [Polypterus senegalus]XP_039599351.1 PWWP domain-containing DNA repair factor 3B-like [Polypterus senegalus]